jgi:murein DD-endopeptidase MepM/ murein hydrolase activator NlpD
MLRWLAGAVAAVLISVGVLYVMAGRSAPPRLTIEQPGRFVGQAGALDVVVETPNGHLTTLTIAVEQNGKATPLFAMTDPQSAVLTQIDRDHLRIMRPIGKASVPELRAGPARLVVSATRPSFLNLRALTSTATKEFQVRLEPPRVTVVSTHHYVNHGGSEMVVYRATPSDVESGVRVGDVEYPGFPASGIDDTISDPALKVAFFALLHDQDLGARILAFARDEAANDVAVSFVDKVFTKPFKRSRIEIDDRFMGRVVPEILDHTPNLKSTSGEDLLAGFLAVNGQLRRDNADEIRAFAKKTSPRRLWRGPFVQLGNSKVEAGFADHRTYLYRGKEIDQQVHLGFDLAVTANVPVVAANDGTILNASWLGIYGNTVLIDHGMGVQSLYGHLSSFDVKVGDTVKRGQTIGRSGMTGLAGGDHLHFTMLVAGRMVNPVEWWDPHWIADRVERKLGEAR